MNLFKERWVSSGWPNYFSKNWRNLGACYIQYNSHALDKGVSYKLKIFSVNWCSNVLSRDMVECITLLYILRKIRVNGANGESITPSPFHADALFASFLRKSKNINYQFVLYTFGPCGRPFDSDQAKTSSHHYEFALVIFFPPFFPLFRYHDIGVSVSYVCICDVQINFWAISFVSIEIENRNSFRVSGCKVLSVQWGDRQIRIKVGVRSRKVCLGHTQFCTIVIFLDFHLDEF